MTTKITEKQQELIDEIMDEFDFRRVHKTMEFLNWHWGGRGVPAGELRVPSLAELRKEARRMLKDCCLEGHYSTESGGLRAEYFAETVDEVEWMRLSFILADWSAPVI